MSVIVETHRIVIVDGVEVGTIDDFEFTPNGAPMSANELRGIADFMDALEETSDEF